MKFLKKNQTQYIQVVRVVILVIQNVCRRNNHISFLAALYGLSPDLDSHLTVFNYCVTLKLLQNIPEKVLCLRGDSWKGF